MIFKSIKTGLFHGPVTYLTNPNYDKIYFKCQFLLFCILSKINVCSVQCIQGLVFYFIFYCWFKFSFQDLDCEMYLPLLAKVSRV